MNASFELRVTLDERTASLLTSIAQSLELLSHPLVQAPARAEAVAASAPEVEEPRVECQAVKRDRAYRAVLDEARASGASYKRAAREAEKLGFLVSGPSLRQWSIKHGCSLGVRRRTSPEEHRLLVERAAGLRERMRLKQIEGEGNDGQTVDR